MTGSVDAIRGALDGAIPATVATCSPDGVPNISYVSQVYYVDAGRVALSYQFFNKTRANVLATRRATALVIDPFSYARYRIALEYERLETSGPLYERMKAHLAGIASHTGMAGVFRLQGADVYPCHAGRRTGGGVHAAGRRAACTCFATVRAIAQRIAGCADLSHLLDEALAALDDSLGIRYAMILMADDRAGRLYTVASRGYDASGVGSEIAFGEGVVGVAAREKTPIRIMHRANEWVRRAIRDGAAAGGMAALVETEIPLPGLPDARSQLAVPVVVGSSLTAILYVEDVQDRRFDYDDEDALVAVAALLGPMIRGMQELAEAVAEAGPARAGCARAARRPSVTACGAPRRRQHLPSATTT